jgi:hypothetical protein
MPLAVLPLTPPPPNLAALLKYIAPFLAHLGGVLDMSAPKLSWKPRALDFDGLDGHIIEVLLLEAVKIGVRVVGLEGMNSAVFRVSNWCACQEGG